MTHALIVKLLSCRLDDQLVERSLFVTAAHGNYVMFVHRMCPSRRNINTSDLFQMPRIRSKYRFVIYIYPVPFAYITNAERAGIFVRIGLATK